ncbi:MAG: heavy metal translocating P-type ATPase, partial [Chloroflexota bacterium]
MQTIEVEASLPDNGECTHCLDRLRGSLVLIAGVDQVAADPRRGSLTVSYDPEVVSPSQVKNATRDLSEALGHKYAHRTLTVADMDCADCAAKLEAGLRKMTGVVTAEVNFAAGKIFLEYEAELVELAKIVSRIEGMGYGVDDQAAAETTTEFRIGGMDCADCALTLERNIATMGGVAEAKVNFASSTLVVRHGPKISPAKLSSVVEASGYTAMPLRAPAGERRRSFWLRNRRAILTSASGVALLLGIVLNLVRAPAIAGLAPAADIAFALAMILGGYHPARSGLYALLKSRTADMNVLMTIAGLGAAAIGQWAEGATVIFLFAFGNTLEGYTMDRARGAIRALMNMAPAEAHVKRNGAEISLPAEQVGVGEVVVIRPGEKIPVDGVVVAGASAVNQASVTGESVPVDRAVGDEVYAGSINERGYLEVEATKPYAENTISRIINLVEKAQAQRAPSQRFVDAFSRYYTPLVIAGAIALATVPWLAFGQPFQMWFYRALVLLVISCPCALVISTPVSIVSAIARAARLGVLVKGGAHLEETGAIRVVAFDKTGTLTVGRPEVTDVVPLNHLTAAEVLSLTAAIESRSEHPLAAAIVRKSAADAHGHVHARHQHEEHKAGDAHDHHDHD